MARSRQVTVTPGTVATLAGSTLGGGLSVTVFNTHATEPMILGGDENGLQGGQAVAAGVGMKLAAGKYFSCVLDGNETITAISGTTTVTVTAAVFCTNFRGSAHVVA